MPFEVRTAIDVSDGRPGMMIPILTQSSNNNLPFVQQMDEYFYVTGFIPFPDYENYPTVPIVKNLSVDISEQGVIIFRRSDGHIFCGTISDALSYIDEHRSIIDTSSLLKVQLNRIEGAELAPSYEAWKVAAQSTFVSDDQRRRWVESEHTLFQKQKRIWADLSRDDPEDEAKRGLPGSPADYSDEYLINWLSSRRNFESTSWTQVWHFVAARQPFDARLAQLGMNWAFTIGEDDDDLLESRSVLLALVGQFGRAELPWRDFSAFVTERIRTKPYLILEFSGESAVFWQFLSTVFSLGDPDDVLQIADFVIEELPAIRSIVVPLLTALASWSEDEHDRTHSQIEGAEQRTAKLKEKLASI